MVKCTVLQVFHTHFATVPQSLIHSPVASELTQLSSFILNCQFYNAWWVCSNSISISQYPSSVPINPYCQKYKTYAGYISVPIPKVRYCRSTKLNPCLYQRTKIPNVYPQALVAWYTALSVGRLLRLMRTFQMTGPKFQNRKPKDLKNTFTPLDVRWSLSAPAVIRLRRGIPPGNPGGTLGSPVLSGSCSRAEQVPSGSPELLPWKAEIKDSIV